MENCYPCWFYTQVVGLSASLGVGESRDVSAAAEHVIYICSTMDAEKLCTVEHNTEELQMYTKAAEVSLHKVMKTDYDKFGDVVNRVMSKIEEQAMDKFNVAGFRINERAEQPYRNCIDEACVAAFGNRFLMTYLEHLREYHIALTIAKVSRMADALNYLKRYFERHDESKYTVIDHILKNLFESMIKEIEDYIKEHGEPSNPKLEKIKKLIIRYHTEDGKARGILFTKTRESTLALESWIKETEALKELINAARIIGSGGGEGMINVS